MSALKNHKRMYIYFLILEFSKIVYINKIKKKNLFTEKINLTNSSIIEDNLLKESSIERNMKLMTVSDWSIRNVD